MEKNYLVLTKATCHVPYKYAGHAHNDTGQTFIE